MNLKRRFRRTLVVTIFLIGVLDFETASLFVYLDSLVPVWNDRFVVTLVLDLDSPLGRLFVLWGGA